MSWGLQHQCGTCAKEAQCADRFMIQAGINSAHSLPGAWMNPQPPFGHFGGGTIRIECQNHKPKIAVAA